jgi:arylmalonate decarboxylase
VSADLRPWYRLGYVSPHPTVDTMAYEIYRMAPPGFMLVTAGLAIGDYTRAAVEAELPALGRAVSLLVERRVQRIVLSGVPIAAALGRARVLTLLEDAGGRAGVTVDTDLEAIVAGAYHLGVRKVALATRWKDDVNRALTTYLAEAGIEVLGLASSPGAMADNARLDDAGGMALATRLGAEALRSAPAAEALIMPGARWVAIHTLETLEREHGRPVLLNHASALWAALRSARYDRPVVGWGRLLGSLG